MKTILTSIFLILILSNSFAQQVVEANANLKSVTVYNSSAEINYQKELRLPKGKSSVVFTNLTPFIVDNTINMSVLNPDVDIVTVTEKINHIKKRKNKNDQIVNLRDSVKMIKQVLGLLKAETEALTVEKELLFKGGSIGGVDKGVTVAEIEKASLFFNKRYTTINTQIFYHQEKEKQLLEQLNKFNNQINEVSKNTEEPCSEITVTVFSPSDQKVMFLFKFLTQKAGWAPVYDCKFEGPKKPIQFVFRANVFNGSGVPWNDVELKLSTASPTAGFDIPSLEGEVMNEKKIKSEGSVRFKEIKVRNTVAEYDIKHSYTILSDSKPYLIDVKNYKMKANYHYLLIPKVDAFGFLMADIPDWNKYNLIPGNTNIYSMGSYMGKTFLDTYAESDTLNMYLGKDNNVTAIKKEKNRNSKQKIIGNYYVDRSEIDIVVKNNSAESLTIQLLDQVPIFKIGEKIKFNIHGIEKADYNNKDGALIWKLQLLPSESITIEYKFEIKIPKDNIGNYKPRKGRFRTISSPSF